MKVLGIETSCDETGIALYDSEQGLLSDALYSQIELHKQYGGVVPELASRDHVRKILPLIEEVLDKAQVSKKDLDGIAYTKGPGLIGALLVGATLGRSLAYALNIPAIGIHHMEGHLLAPMLSKEKPTFPFIALLVSGGHTMLIRVETLGKYVVLGDTLDDAAGEAFDKVAKLLGCSYPGGPAIEKLAQKGNSSRFTFPRPMVNRPGLDFSFSGLKTFALNTLQKEGDSDQTKADVAYAFQEAVVETFVIKCRRAFYATGLNELVVAGGVSANNFLRERLNEEAKKLRVKIFYPKLAFCTDNGAMIAYAGCLRLAAGQKDDLDIHAQARWPIENCL